MDGDGVVGWYSEGSGDNVGIVGMVGIVGAMVWLLVAKTSR